MQHLSPETLAQLAAGESHAELAPALAHLDTCEACASRLRLSSGDDPTTRVLVSAAQPQPPALPAQWDASALQRGAMVGRYLVLHALGEGGMGVVYAAYDPELDRKVALKLLLAAEGPSADQSEGRARLLREAQALARVSHPHVTAVHDVGVFGDRVFMAMDLVQGTTLGAWLKQRRPWRQVLEVMQQAGRGLAAAHAAGLVHRDFKPDNVLVGEDGRVQVTDFGLARLQGESASDTLAESDERMAGAQRLLSPLTQVGLVMGTPAYMAPEQHRGQSPDARSDQFSFCVTLYLALYGRRPFDSRQMADAARNGAGKEPSTRTPFSSLRAVKGNPVGLILPPPRRPWVPGWLKRAMMRGLALHPEDRFPSMEALLERLAGPPVAVRRARAVGLGALLVGASAFAYHSVQQRQGALCSGAELQLHGVWDEQVAQRVEAGFLGTERPYAAQTFAAVRGALDSYAQRWVEMHTEACRATRLRGEQPESVLTLRMVCLERRLRHLSSLTAVLAQPDGPVVDKAVDAATALPGLAACADTGALLAAEPLPEEPAVRQKIQQAHAQLAEVHALETAGRYKQALPLAQQVVAAARDLPYRPLQAEALYQLGVVQVQGGNMKAAEQSFSESFWLAESARYDGLKVDAATRLMNAVTQFQQGRFEVSQLWSKLAESALERMGGDLEREAALRMRQTWVLCRTGRCAEGQAPLERILARVEREKGPDHPLRASLLTTLSWVYTLRKELPRARQALEQSISLVERVRGPGHPSLAIIHLNLAEVLSSQEEHPQALSHAERGRALVEQAHGKGSMMMAGACEVLGGVHLMAGRAQEALEFHRQSLALRERAFGPKNATLSSSLLGQGRAYLELKRAAEALAVLERAYALDLTEPALKADVRFALAQALVAAGKDRSRALALAEEARAGFGQAHRPEEVAKVERWLQAHRP